MNRTLLAAAVALVFAIPWLASAQEAAPAESALESASETSDSGSEARVECLDAFARAQRLRREALLIEARQALLACAQAGCFEVVRVKCTEWLEEVEADIPTLVLAITDERGQASTRARVLIDGGGASAALGGRALEINPGTHDISVELRNGKRIEKAVTILQGKKNQLVTFDFTPPEEPVDTTPQLTIVRERSSVNMPAAVAFGVTGAALVAGIITGALALRDGQDLEEQCDAEGCQQEEIDDGLALAHASTATFVIAGVAGVMGVTFLFVIDDDPQPNKVALRLGPTSAALELRF